MLRVYTVGENRGRRNQLISKVALKNTLDISKKTKKAFTIVELLAVMLIVGVLATIGIMASIGMLNAPGFTNSIKEVASTLEFARTEAMTKRKDIYVAFIDASTGLTGEEEFETNHKMYGVFQEVTAAAGATNIDTEAIVPWKKLHPSISFSTIARSIVSSSQPTGNSSQPAYTFYIDNSGGPSGTYPYLKFNKFGKASSPGAITGSAYEIHFSKLGQVNTTDQSLPYIKVHQGFGRVEVIDY